MSKLSNTMSKRKSRAICIPIEEQKYKAIVINPYDFRDYLDSIIQRHPEIFPKEIVYGYHMKDQYLSSKQNIIIRRIVLKSTNISYSVRPSYLMPYMVGKTQEIKTALFLRQFAVPFWALVTICGRNKMYWYRIVVSIGRNSIVGSLCRKESQIPKHLCVDEKHSKLKRNKVYIPMTAAKECLFGISITENADELSLEDGYSDFKTEAISHYKKYSPETVNTDGWLATGLAWKNLFKPICVILCILHVYIKIRDRFKHKGSIFVEVSERLWNAFRALNRKSFSQRIRRLHEWTHENTQSGDIVKQDPLLNRITTLRKNLKSYSHAYLFPGSYRTSTHVDRTMRRLDRYLFNMQYFRGSLTSAYLHLRAWAVLHNFWPFSPDTVESSGFLHRADRFNRFHYHDCWLQNLLISSSLRGFR